MLHMWSCNFDPVMKTFENAREKQQYQTVSKNLLTFLLHLQKFFHSTLTQMNLSLTAQRYKLISTFKCSQKNYFQFYELLLFTFFVNKKDKLLNGFLATTCTNWQSGEWRGYSGFHVLCTTAGEVFFPCLAYGSYIFGFNRFLLRVYLKLFRWKTIF